MPSLHRDRRGAVQTGFRSSSDEVIGPDEERAEYGECIRAETLQVGGRHPSQSEVRRRRDVKHTDAPRPILSRLLHLEASICWRRSW